MEFLVNIRFLDWTSRLTEQEHADLVVTERAHAAELAAQGILVRMWRVPGRRENWGLWRARDATELHTVLTSLPAQAVKPHPRDVASAAVAGA